MSFELLKLNKALLSNVQEAEFSSPLPLQTKILPRIFGGQELICVGPEGSGKSTSLVISVLNRLKHAFEEAPRAMVLVVDKEHAIALIEKFELLGARTGIRTLGLYSGAGMEGQKEALAEGVDVIVGTPDRVLAIYLKSALNMNKLQQFILDDAEKIVKQGFQSQIHQLVLSLPKCQRLIFTEVMHDKLERLSSAFQANPIIVESEFTKETHRPTIPLLLYHVPNYKTKQNLLNLLIGETETYRKVIMFVNTRLTAQNLYKSLSKRFPDEIALLKPPIYEHQGFKTTEDFKKSQGSRVLIVANEIEQFIDHKGIDFIFHFDLPKEKEVFLQRVDIGQFSQNSAATAVTFATDIELILVKKIEQETGHAMKVVPLPSHLIVEGSRKKKTENAEELLAREKSPVSNQGAFHEKKASNAKDYNWGWKEKNKLFGKKYKKSNKK